jgi:hypothetical protein
MKGRNSKKRTKYSFIVIIFTLFLLSLQIVLANDQISFSFKFSNPNRPPVIHNNEYPTNDSINVRLKVICHVQVSDPDNNTLNIYWYENSTGAWVLRQTDSQVLNGTYYWTYLQATSYSTTYYWEVIVNDGEYFTTAVYHFTTEPMPSPPPSPPTPPEKTNQPPIAKITGPNNAYTNETLVFYASNSYDPDGNIIGYQWDFENDGVFDTGWIEDTLVTHSYSSPGNYTVILQVKDDDGAIATASHIIDVIQLEPSLQLPIPLINASFYYRYINKNIILPGLNGPYYGYTNENITFNSTGTYDPDGIIINYTWDFGDNFISYAENPIHSYSKQGNYTVILIVTDNDNLKNLTTTKAIIRDREIKEPEKERELPLTFLLILIIAIIVAIIIALLFLPRGYQVTVLIEKDESRKNEDDNIESKVDEILSESDKDK